MIKELRKFCGYYKESIKDNFCFHPLNFKIDSDDDIDKLLNQPTVKCSEGACPFMDWISVINRYSEAKKGWDFKTEKASDYLLI